jgi:single-stranded DNA-binding protein
MLAVSRRYGRADYLPVIAWGQLAVAVSKCKVGDPIRLEGRIQSRLYTKITDAGAVEHTAYEVSVMHLLDLENEPASC